jgi:hypothetical protein
MINRNYSCGEADLYTICRIIWLLCLEHLDKLANYKSKYTADYANDNLALIKTIEALPSYNVRTEAVKNSFKDVGTEQSDAGVFFKQLKGYIKETYLNDKTLCAAQIMEAGQSNFEKMTKNDWREAKGLYTAMVNFVQKYQEDLMNKGYMPKTFLARLQSSQSGFLAAHQSYETNSSAAPDAAEAKIIANNDLKTQAMAFLADGQIVFADDKTMAQKFVWATIQADVRGTKPTGVGGFITDAVTEAPLSIATATIAKLDKTVSADDKGHYELSPLSPDTYSIEFKAEGYETQVVKEKDVKSSVMGRLNIALVPIAKV